MRILMLTHRFPYPPNRGDRIRSYNLLRFLAANHRISLACPTHERVSHEEMQHVSDLCGELSVESVGRPARFGSTMQSLLTGKSLTEGFFHSRKLVKTIRDWHAAHAFDAVLVFCSSMFPYVRSAGLNDVAKVVDLVDVDSRKWAQMASRASRPKRWLYALEAKRVGRLESEIAATVPTVVLAGDDEAKLFSSCVNDACAAHGIGNGVDTVYFSPSPDRALHSGSIKIVFTGVLDYAPNVEGLTWFCHRVWPEIRKDLDARLEIVGRRPTSAMLLLNKVPGVHVVGEVPDVRPYLQSADIAISPLQLARGIQNKVLEAMASSLPVVLTSQSAEGIDAAPGLHFQVADSAEEFAKAVINLGRSETDRLAMGKAARALVETSFSWSAKLAGFQRLLEQARSECDVGIAS